jgi:hypothetical protein
MNYLPIEFGVLSGMRCGDVVPPNGSASKHPRQKSSVPSSGEWPYYIHSFGRAARQRHSTIIHSPCRESQYQARSYYCCGRGQHILRMKKPVAPLMSMKDCNLPLPPVAAASRQYGGLLSARYNINQAERVSCTPW